MKATTMKKSNNARISKQTLNGLKALEEYLNEDDLVYILRSLHKIILKSGRLKESKKQLTRHIQTLEKDSNLPGVMSSISIDLLFEQLEDAQYFHPICRREMVLPKLH
jgi:hypothetical protein